MPQMPHGAPEGDCASRAPALPGGPGQSSASWPSLQSLYLGLLRSGHHGAHFRTNRTLKLGLNMSRGRSWLSVWAASSWLCKVSEQWNGGGGHLVLISSQPVLRFIDHLYSEGVMGGRGP